MQGLGKFYEYYKARFAIIQGVMTYLEIGPDTRVRTAVMPSTDRVEYAEVNHAQPQKNNVGKFSTSLIHWEVGI